MSAAASLGAQAVRDGRDLDIVTGARIPLDILRYWSAARQEAYASAQIASEALRP